MRQPILYSIFNIPAYQQSHQSEEGVGGDAQVVLPGNYSVAQTGLKAPSEFFTGRSCREYTQQHVLR
jgi:hypothetical protein